MVGDVNSTVACALTAAKLGVKVAHVEAGLRSFDRTMPEEYNRVLTNHIADLLFTTEPSANENLRREGIPEENVHFVGNVMIDTLVRLLPKAENREWKGDGGKRNVLNYQPRYGTLDRPELWDGRAAERIVKVLELWQDWMARDLPEEVQDVEGGHKRSIQARKN